MRMPRDRRPFVRGDALHRLLVECPEEKRRCWLLAECVEAYLVLDEEQESVFKELLKREPYMELMPTMLTTREKAIQEGRQMALREAILVVLEKRFGPLSPAVKQRVEDLPEN